MVHQLSACEHRGKYMGGLRFLCHFPELIGSAYAPLRPCISLGSDFYGASACVPALVASFIGRTRFGPGNQLEEGLRFLCHFPELIGSAYAPLRPCISLGSDFYGASACVPALVASFIGRTRFGPENQLEEGLCFLVNATRVWVRTVPCGLPPFGCSELFGMKHLCGVLGRKWLTGANS